MEAPTLPPKPQIRELPEANSVQDLVETINYYEHLVELWELWGESAEAIINRKTELELSL